MYRYVIPVLLALAFLSLPAHADQTERGVLCVTEPFRVSGTAINATTGKLAKAGGASASTTDWLPVGKARDFSLSATIEATQTVSVVYTVQCAPAIPGTALVAHTPATGVTLTATANGAPKISIIALPVCDYVRVSVAADATYPTTTTSLLLSRR